MIAYYFIYLLQIAHSLINYSILLYQLSTDDSILLHLDDSISFHSSTADSFISYSILLNQLSTADSILRHQLSTDHSILLRLLMIAYYFIHLLQIAHSFISYSILLHQLSTDDSILIH